MAGLAAGLGEPVRYVLDWGRRYTLWTLHFGLACCAVEFVAASVGRPDLIRLGVAPATAGPDRADLLVVAGTVTDAMAPAILELYQQLAPPRYVISFGACANTGGPYWDSYSVTKGVDQLIPVDIYVPGCPPRPEALRQAIARLHEQLSAPRPTTPRPVEALTAPLVRPGQAPAGRAH